MDSVTGPAGVFALLAALHYRAATGRGQVIELAQSENVIAQLGDVFVDLQLGPGSPSATATGTRTSRRRGCYRCADGRLLAVTVTDDDAWRALAGVLGRAGPGGGRRPGHRRGACGRPRRAGRGDRLPGPRPWTPAAAFASLQAAGVAAAPQLSEADLAADPQVAARDWIRPLESTDVGRFDHLGHAFRGMPLAWTRGAPVLGEDNEYVFRELLGLDEEAYRRLVARGVAGEDYLDPSGRPH